MGTNRNNIQTSGNTNVSSSLSLHHEPTHTYSPLTYKGVTHVQPRIREVGARFKKIWI